MTEIVEDVIIAIIAVGLIAAIYWIKYGSPFKHLSEYEWRRKMSQRKPKYGEDFLWKLKKAWKESKKNRR